MNNGSGTSVPYEKDILKLYEVKVTLSKNSLKLCGAKAPLPDTLGNETLVSYKDNLSGGTEVPLPKNAEVPSVKHSNLPHIDIKGYYQFVTFRTFDSVDDYLKKLHGLEKPQKQKQQAIDDYLDGSKSGAYLNNQVLQYLYDFFISKDVKLYELVAFCIMPNHVHLLFKPFDKLSVVMQNIKGATANGINKILNKTGKFWASDYYDKAIRDERHFFVVYEYIKNNRLKLSGTEVPLPNRFYGIYEKSLAYE